MPTDAEFAAPSDPHRVRSTSWRRRSETWRHLTARNPDPQQVDLVRVKTPPRGEAASSLRHFNPRESCHEHNELQRAPQFSPSPAGKSVALISDAGTPLMSDPGFRLVSTCREPESRHPDPGPVRRHRRTVGIRSATDSFLLPVSATAQGGPDEPTPGTCPAPLYSCLL